MGTCSFSFRFSFFISRATIIHFFLFIIYHTFPSSYLSLSLTNTSVSICVMFFLFSFHYLTDPQVEEGYRTWSLDTVIESCDSHDTACTYKFFLPQSYCHHRLR